VKRGLLGLIMGTSLTFAVMATALPADAKYGGGGQVSYGDPTPAPVTPVPPSSSPSGGIRSGSDTTANEGGCHFYAGPGGFGQHCYHPGSTSTGHILTVGEILAGDPLPVCWDTALTPDELTTDRLTNTATYTWFSRQCLTGIGPSPAYTIGPDGPSITHAIIALPAGSTPPTLTTNQQHLVGLYAAGRGDYPAVIAIPNNSGVARVNQQVAFHGAPAATPVETVGGTAMQARVTHLTIHPLGSGNTATTDCTGAGASTSLTDTPTITAPGTVCWYQFHTSSVDQPDQKFPMTVTATWEVRYTTNPNQPWNNWTTLGTNIHTTNTTNQKVTQIQTIVIN